MTLYCLTYKLTLTFFVLVAEKLIVERLLKNTKAPDNFKLQFKDLSTKLECQKKINIGKQEICKLIDEKETAKKKIKESRKVSADEEASYKFKSEVSDDDDGSDKV